MIELYKELARNKNVTVDDTISYALLRAIYAKSEDKVELARYFVAKAFIKTKNWNAFSKAYCSKLRYRKLVFGQEVEQSLVDEMLKLCSLITQSYINRKYCYIFVRQDISVEYQMVQAAHAAMLGGYRNGIPPEHIYFQLVGVKNLEELNIAFARHGGHMFIEPDIGNEATAFCTRVLNVVERRPLQTYGLLKC